MDIQKITHIGTECVLFIGMFVYFNNQMKKLKHENEELQNKLTTLHENTNKQFNNIYMVLDNFKNTMNPAPLQFQQAAKVLGQRVKGMQIIDSTLKQRKKSDTEQPSRRQVKFEEPIDDDLDAELGEELQELEEEDEEDQELQVKDMKASYNNGKKK